MRPTEISDEDIIKAGKGLLAAGRNVTGFALRQRVGGGSAPRLKQVWDEHISSQSVVSIEQEAELPVELEEQLKEVKELDRQLNLFGILTAEGAPKNWKESEAELKKERAAMLRSIKELKKALDKTEAC